MTHSFRCTDGSGDLDDDEFYKGLKKLGVDVSRREAKKMMDRFPSRVPGAVLYRDFIRGLKLRQPEVDIRDLEDELRRELRRLEDSRHGRPRFDRVFRDLDRNGDGAVSRRRFREGMDTMGFNLRDRDLKRLMQRFDRHGDGIDGALQLSEPGSHPHDIFLL